MNERIKELAKQSGVYFGSATQDYFGEWHPAFTNTEDIDFEEFAQLIVAECATIILNNDIEKQEDYGVNHLFFNGWERGVIDSCQIIKKHFGVE